jgi:hypothetical protein
MAPTRNNASSDRRSRRYDPINEIIHNEHGGSVIDAFQDLFGAPEDMEDIANVLGRNVEVADEEDEPMGDSLPCLGKHTTNTSNLHLAFHHT